MPPSGNRSDARPRLTSDEEDEAHPACDRCDEPGRPRCLRRSARPRQWRIGDSQTLEPRHGRGVCIGCTPACHRPVRRSVLRSDRVDLLLRQHLRGREPARRPSGRRQSRGGHRGVPTLRMVLHGELRSRREEMRAGAASRARGDSRRPLPPSPGRPRRHLRRDALRPWERRPVRDVPLDHANRRPASHARSSAGCPCRARRADRQLRGRAGVVQPGTNPRERRSNHHGSRRDRRGDHLRCHPIHVEMLAGGDRLLGRPGPARSRRGRPRFRSVHVRGRGRTRRRSLRGHRFLALRRDRRQRAVGRPRVHSGPRSDLVGGAPLHPPSGPT